MDATSYTTHAPVITVPLSDLDRAFLRAVRIAGGCLSLVTLAHRQSAAACREGGYVRISADGKTVRLTGTGQAYLDRLMRAH